MTPFGTCPDGSAVHAVEIGGPRLAAVILTHGARLHRLSFDGSPNLMAGSPDLAGYLGADRYSGPVVGPVVNRIAGATAEIAGRAYRFEANQDGRHSLHSGVGAQDHVWEVVETAPDRVRMRLALEDGAGGFPGNRELEATYGVDGSDLRLELRATSDAATLMNLAHHGVWNLDGADSWQGHRLRVETERYLPTDGDKIPTGDVAEVTGTAYDHRSLRGADPTLDHNFCFEASSEPRLLARLEGATGRALEVLSDAPGLQVYAGGPRGIALEPQLWPDAPHHPHFPSILLDRGEVFRQETVFRLSGG